MELIILYLYNSENNNERRLKIIFNWKYIIKLKFSLNEMDLNNKNF